VGVHRSLAAVKLHVDLLGPHNDDAGAGLIGIDVLREGGKLHLDVDAATLDRGRRCACEISVRSDLNCEVVPPLLPLLDGADPGVHRCFRRMGSWGETPKEETRSDERRRGQGVAASPIVVSGCQWRKSWGVRGPAAGLTGKRLPFVRIRWGPARSRP